MPGPENNPRDDEPIDRVSYEKWEQEQRSKSCTCIQCGLCKGSGNIELPTKGYPEWDLETCPECRGSGMSEMCEEHAQREDDDY